MRSILVSTTVFARIWALRGPGEESENDILSRILFDGTAESGTDSGTNPMPTAPSIAGHRDRRYGVDFAKDFEISRTYLGTDFKARSTSEGWILVNDGKTYRTLNELSRAIGAKIENAWVNWFFYAPDGKRKPISELRDPRKITRRTSRRVDSDNLLTELEDLTLQHDLSAKVGATDMNVKTLSRLQDIRNKSRTGEITMDELREGIQLMREDRSGDAKTLAGSTQSEAKTPKPLPQDSLERNKLEEGWPDSQSEHEDDASMTWKEILVEVGLGYQTPQHRSRWLRDAEALARRNGRSIPKSVEQTIQQVFESQCDGSKLYKGTPGKALFRFSEGKGAGYWAINRDSAEQFKTTEGK